MDMHLSYHFQAAYATSWNILRLNAASARTVCNCVWGYDICPCRAGVWALILLTPYLMDIHKCWSLALLEAVFIFLAEVQNMVGTTAP